MARCLSHCGNLPLKCNTIKPQVAHQLFSNKKPDLIALPLGTAAGCIAHTSLTRASVHCVYLIALPLGTAAGCIAHTSLTRASVHCVYQWPVFRHELRNNAAYKLVTTLTEAFGFKPNKLPPVEAAPRHPFTSLHASIQYYTHMITTLIFYKCAFQYIIRYPIVSHIYTTSQDTIYLIGNLQR